MAHLYTCRVKFTRLRGTEKPANVGAQPVEHLNSIFFLFFLERFWMGIDSGKRKKFAMEEVACVTAAKPETNLKSAWMIHYGGQVAVGVDAIHTALGTPLWLAHIDTVRVADDEGPVSVALLHLRRPASASDMERVLRDLVRAGVFPSAGSGVWLECANPFEAGTYLDRLQIEAVEASVAREAALRHLRLWERRDRSAWRRGETVLFPFKPIYM